MRACKILGTSALLSLIVLVRGVNAKDVEVPPSNRTGSENRGGGHGSERSPKEAPHNVARTPSSRPSASAKPNIKLLFIIGAGFLAFGGNLDECNHKQRLFRFKRPRACDSNLSSHSELKKR